MPLDAKYRYGEVVTTQYAHGAPTVKGEVINPNSSSWVAAEDLGVSVLGTYNARGGVYEMIVDQGYDIVVGSKIFYSGGFINLDTGAHFGYALSAGGAGDAVLVHHRPEATEL